MSLDTDTLTRRFDEGNSPLAEALLDMGYNVRGEDLWMAAERDSRPAENDEDMAAAGKFESECALKSRCLSCAARLATTRSCARQQTAPRTSRSLDVLWKVAS